MADQSDYRITAELAGIPTPVTRFELYEHLSEPYEGRLWVYDTGFTQQPLSAEVLLDKGAIVTLWKDDQVIRHVHGIIHAVHAGAVGKRRRYFSVTIVPELQALQLITDCRIFQGLDVQDIVQTLLNEQGIRLHRFVLTGTRKPRKRREFCVQYNETTFDFIHRLLAEEGIFYYFEHSNSSHELVFCDFITQTRKIAPLHYQERSANKTEPTVWSLDYTEQRVPTHTIQRDRTFHAPWATLEQGYQGLYLDHQRAGAYQTYRYNGRYKTSAQGKDFTQYYQQQSQNAQRLATFQHDYLHTKEGILFHLEGHPVEARNDTWVSVQNHLTVEQPQSTEEEAQANYNQGTEIPTKYASHFECTTECLPYPQQYSPPAWPKPEIKGPQVADVVGPPGEEIYCDEYGRVRLKFPWDYRAKGDDTSSCWIRVAQNWAGDSWGHIAIPRIGQEVIVDFLEGDPDQPIITGRNYHSRNRPPYRLPQHKTRMTIKSKTHKGTGYNELRFEDKTNGEQIYLHGQKDYDIILENDRKEWIRHDRHLRVDNDKFEQVHQDSHQTIGQDKSDRIERHRYFYAGGNFIWRVIGQVHRWIGGGLQLFVGAGRSTEIKATDELVIGADQLTGVGNLSYTRARNIVLEANESLTVKAPGGFIKIDTSGIYIKGNFVKLNSGGSPDAGTAPKPPAPEEPQVPTIPKDADHRGER